MYSPLQEEVHVFTVHPSMHGELAQVAGMALFIFTKLDTAHNGWLVQPQSEILSEERRGEGRVKGREEGIPICKSHELYIILAKEEGRGWGQHMQDHTHAE